MPRFEDFDALREALGDWQLEATQLDRGPFSGELHQYTSQSALITEAKFGRMLHQRGESPGNLRTIAIPGDANQRIQWRGRTVGGDELMIFPDDGELDAVSLGNFHVFTVSIAENDLHENALELEGADWQDLLACRETLRGPSERIEQLRRLASACARSGPEQNPDLGMAHSECEAEIVKLLVGLAAAASNLSSRAQLRSRDLIIRRSLDYIEERIEERDEEPPSISGLCSHVGASRRTLEYAFRERFGASPKAYILARRLEKVRSDLKLKNRQATITHLANRWGFHHLSHFAVLYRRQFGELPSDTRFRLT